jgi:hypothetical protein
MSAVILSVKLAVVVEIAPVSDAAEVSDPRFAANSTEDATGTAAISQSAGGDSIPQMLPGLSISIAI